MRAPGILDMSHAEYHAEHDSLSSTGARKLLPPSCPALFRWGLDNPPAAKKAFEFGNAVHDAVLGGGPEVVVVDADNWLTKAAKAERDEARARNAVPVLADEWAEVQAMVAAVRAHPIAGPLFAPGTGRPEPSLFWTDGRTGVARRARLDWLRDPGPGRTLVPDLKTCLSAERDKFARSAADYGYHMQAAYYLDGIEALDLAGDAVFLFVAVEKTPPHLVNVIQLDHMAMQIGAGLNRQAIDTYRECTETGIWPGYSSDVQLTSLPKWYEVTHEEAIAS